MKNNREAISFLFLVTVMLILTMCGTGCVKKECAVRHTPLLVEVQDLGASISAGITDSIYLARCDKLTFKALLSAYSKQNLSGFEYGGRWERDKEPCYPKDSKSSISLDGILSVLHHIVSTNDIDMLDRLITYGEKHAWVVGEGPEAYTNIQLLVPVIYSLRGTLSLKGAVTVPELKQILSGFRGHLLASFLWLSLRTDGKLSELELQVLNELVEANSADPMYLALWHRIHDGDQQEVFEILLSAPEFNDEGIYERDGVFGWGSAPASAYYLYVLSIIEGN